jgi:hypothetical protein
MAETERATRYVVLEDVGDGTFRVLDDNRLAASPEEAIRTVVEARVNGDADADLADGYVAVARRNWMMRTARQQMMIFVEAPVEPDTRRGAGLPLREASEEPDGLGDGRTNEIPKPDTSRSVAAPPVDGSAEPEPSVA